MDVLHGDAGDCGIVLGMPTIGAKAQTQRFREQDMQLVIGNKNYSSWSMRPWVLMRHFGIRFKEVMIRFDSMEADSKFKSLVSVISQAGRVPVLVDNNGFVVWDTLAIAEYLAEHYPSLALWPQDVQERSLARSYCAEMHSGFSQLRNHCPMNIEAQLPEVGQRLMVEQAGVKADLDRLQSMWTQALNRSGGPFLFGPFGIVDAYFAPVTFRITTYGLPVSPTVSQYINRVHQNAAVSQWVTEALDEKDFVDFDEPYRKSRD
jgi:glutathione S-transferase